MEVGQGYQDFDGTPQQSSPDERIDLDDLFPYVGEYGRYQKLLTWLVVLPACIPCGLATFNQLFMSDDVFHTCTIPKNISYNAEKLGNLSEIELKNILIPIDEETGVLNQCKIRDMDLSDILNESVGEFDSGEFSTDTSELEEYPLRDCPEGWTYSSLPGSLSIVESFNLVCGKEIFPTVALLFTNLGGLFGVFLFGIISDALGRKASYFICLTCQLTGGIGCAFAPTFWTWLCFRVLNGLTVPANYQIPFIICLELVGQNYRGFVTVMTCFFYVGGMMLLSPIAYMIRDWRYLSVCTSAPFILYYFYIVYLPESPRWLLAKNRPEEALKILRKLAEVNETTLPDHLVNKITVKKSTAPAQAGLLDLFRTPNLRLKTILITFCWFANATVYIGLSYYGPALGENPYLSFFLGSAIELPGYMMCWFIMDRFGRRWPLSLCMIIGGIFDVATVLLPSDSKTLLMCFYLIAKFGIASSYLIIYPFAGELFPTEVRGIGLGFSAYFGGIGICCIPLINYLGKSHLLIPLIIMGFVSVLGGVAALRLPETLNAALPSTIEEGEEFGKDFQPMDCVSCPKSGGDAQDYAYRPSVGGTDENEDGELFPLSRMSSIRGESVASSSSGRRSSSQATGKFPPKKRILSRQATSLELPVDSKGTVMLTPWW